MGLYLLENLGYLVGELNRVTSTGQLVAVTMQLVFGVVGRYLLYFGIAVDV